MANYSIWVLEYAYVPSYHVSGIVYGAHNQGYRKLPYCYVLIKGQGTVAMVDVGYNEKDVGAEMSICGEREERRGQDGEGDEHEQRGHQDVPGEDGHPEHRHPRGAHAEDRGDEVDSAEDRA